MTQANTTQPGRILKAGGVSEQNGARACFRRHSETPQSTESTESTVRLTTLTVRHADVDLAIEAAEAAQRGVHRVGPIGRADYDGLRAPLEAVHEGQQLRDDALLHLAVRLLTLGGDGVDLIDEDDRRGVLLSLLEGLV
jgi:hypothetical protein